MKFEMILIAGMLLGAPRFVAAQQMGDLNGPTPKYQLDDPGGYKARATLYGRAAQALSQMQAPDFSDLDKDVVLAAYWAIFDGHTYDREDWLKNFMNDVSNRSHGVVKLEKADMNQFASRCVSKDVFYLGS